MFHRVKTKSHRTISQLNGHKNKNKKIYMFFKNNIKNRNKIKMFFQAC